jgi:Zn-dependent protease with chaperone function
LSPLALLPLLFCLASAVGAWFLPRLLSPPWAARVLSVIVALAAASTLAALALVMLASLSAVPALDRVLGWCTDLYGYAAPPWAGGFAAVALAIGTTRLVRWRRRWHDAIRPWRGAGAVRVVPDGPPLAFAVPGDPGTVVVGSRLLSALDDEEQAVVLAHEHAHLRCRHDRFLRAGDAAAAAVPILIPVARRIRFVTERWADEEVAEDIGDRQLVARAIAKAALLSAGESVTLPAMASSGASARVHALMNRGAPSGGSLVAGAMSAVAVGLALGGSSVQMHHLAAFFTHICTV